jgi:hypothetical protein
MKSFQLVGLSAEMFAPMFALSDAQLAARGARRVVAAEDTGYPCRVSLENARAGDELLLLPFEHQPALAPYRASGPIFVRKGARQRVMEPGEIPEYVRSRLMSVRVYDSAHCMIDATVCEGRDARSAILTMFENVGARYIHLHNAKQGCFSCAVNRV